MKKSLFASLVIVLGMTIQSNAQISGTKTIGPSGDYASFTAAVADLVAQGIDAPVVFNVSAGVYNEQVVIPAITGTSALNTITFQSATGDSTDVIITYASSDVNSNYTVKFDGADFVSFKKLTLRATGSTYARVVEVINGAAFNSIGNSVVTGIAGLDELIYAHSAFDDNLSNTFLNNTFTAGKIGIKYYGAKNTTGIAINFNEFNNQSEKALLINNCQGMEIKGNLITSNQPIDAIAFDEMYTKAITIGNNIIKLPNGGSGIVFSPIAGTYSGNAEESLIYNNFIYINTANNDFGIDFTQVSVNAKVYYNTIHITGNNPASAVFNSTNLNSWSIDIKNNILVNEANGLIFSGGNYFNSDYNDLYTNGTYIAFSAKNMEEWQSGYNKDLHSFFANPYFISNTSWQVQNPLANGAAIPVTEVTSDIDGEARDTTAPDLGVDEFIPAPVPLNGAYSIGGASADYPAVNDAVEDLAINGISGPVVFNIASGTYNEQVVFPEITGTSATNTVTFQSASADSTDVVLTYTPTNTSRRYTIRLNGTDYLILKNLSITTGELWGIPVEFKNEATHNQLQGNKLYKASQASFSWEYALVHATGGANSSNVFAGNYFENGNMGIYLDGADAGTQITDNHFVNIFFQGMYLKNNLSPIITGNTINVSTTSNFSFGIYLDGSSYDGSQKGILANNMILMNNSTGSATGIITPNSSHLSVIYNTVKVSSGKAFSGGSNTDIINNIFTLEAGSFVAEISDTTGCSIDYNLYYQPNSSYADMYYSTGSTSNLEQYGFDLHSFSREPAFISDNDLHTTDPWISNRGTPLTEIITDIDGDLRDNTSPDVGADEYVAATLFAGEYTIGSGGDFGSFTEAADSILKTGAIGPVTFLVESGTYDEQFVLKEIPYVGTGDSITVTFKPQVAGDSTVILQYAGTASYNYVVLLDSADYISFEGITFKALDDTNSNIIYLAHGATHNSFSNNIFIGSPASGPIIYAKSSATNDSDNHFTDNRFYNGSIAISLEGVDDTNKATGLVVNSNTFQNQHTGAIVVHNHQAPEIFGNIILHPNLIAEKWAGIFLGTCSHSQLVNNIISFQADQLSAGIGLNNTNYTDVYYNSIFITGEAADSRCYNEENSSGNNVLKNNILSNEANGLVIYNTDISSFTSDYNGFYVTGSHFSYTDTWIDDLSTWQSTYGKDQHSVFTNPRFVSSTDMHTSNPLLNGSGLVISGITTDIEGNTRDATNPDLGAYEFLESIYVLGSDTSICKNTGLLLDAGDGYSSYQWDTGETTQTIKTDTTNTSDTWYRVTVSFNGTNYSDSLMVSYKGPIIDLVDTAGFCEGASVVLSAGDGSDTYEWSTGSADPNITVSTTGAYFVKVTDSEGCVARDTVKVIASSGPIVDLGADTSFCAGDTLSLDAGAGSDYTYLWNDHSTNRTIDIFESGQYSVTVTDQYGCDNSDDIAITENPLPNVDLGQDQTVCNGFSATLDAGPGFAKYLWADGTGFQSTSVDASGNYTVTVWDGNGCANSDTVMVTVNPPFTPALSSSGDELQVDYQTGTNYEWYVNQSYYSATTSPSLSPNQSGDYYVRVTDEFGCFGTTNTVTFIITGIEEAGRQIFQIYPNPSDGHLTIHYPGGNTSTELMIFNARGNIVYQKASGINTKGFEEGIDLSGISKGVYLLRINVNGQVFNQKLLIE